MFPFLTTEQMVEVDRAMIEEFGIDLVRMMENAGRALAHLARERFLDGDARGRCIVVLAGTGGNGGGALVAARRLHNYGADVTVLATRSDESFAPVPRDQLAIVRRIEIAVGSLADAGSLGESDVILDGLIGYSLRGAPPGMRQRDDRLGESVRCSGVVVGRSVRRRHHHGRRLRPGDPGRRDDDARPPQGGPARPRASPATWAISTSPTSASRRTSTCGRSASPVAPLFAASDIVRLV